MATKSATKGRGASRRTKAPAEGALRVVVTDARYAELCRGSIKRMPSGTRSMVDLVALQSWDDSRFPSNATLKVWRTLFISRLADISEEAARKARQVSGARYLVFSEGMPVEALASRLPRLDIRDEHRLHVARKTDEDSQFDIIYRLLSGMAYPQGPKAIVDAWVEDDQLVVLSPSFDRLSVPLEKVSEFIGKSKKRIREFEIDEDGRFLYWPHADAHLGWEQLLQTVEPAAALAAKQKSQKFNERYGTAIRAVREERGLKQSDIGGLTARHLRRVEHGEQPASKATLEALAKAHGMALETYLQEVASRLA